MMRAERVAELMISAMMGKPSLLFRETWIARGVALLSLYIFNYVPDLYTVISTISNDTVLKNWREGRGFLGQRAE